MERVTGIGGFFFRARDPEALSRWYEQHLGVANPPRNYEDPVWWQEAGPTIWAPFPSESEHFHAPEQTWSINFRVPDLDAMVAQLRNAEIRVDLHPEEYPNGRFAEIVDPEGNPIQLWEPSGQETEPPDGSS